MLVTRGLSHTRMEVGHALFVLPPKDDPAVKVDPRILAYPCHPYPPELCAAIAKLPEGFRELALSGRLSTQLITQLGPSQLISHSYTRADIVNPITQQWHMAIMRLTKLERTIYLTLFLFKARIVIGAGYKTLANLILDWDNTGVSRHEQEWLIWAAILVASCPDSSILDLSERRAVMNGVLGKNFELWSWSRLEKILRKFFWTSETAVRWQRSWTEMTLRDQNRS